MRRGRQSRSWSGAATRQARSSRGTQRSWPGPCTARATRPPEAAGGVPSWMPAAEKGQPSAAVYVKYTRLVSSGELTATLTPRWTCAQPTRTRNACTITAPVCRSDSGKICAWMRAAAFAQTALPCSSVGAGTSDMRPASNHCLLSAGCNSTEKAHAARGGNRLELCHDRRRLRLTHGPLADARDCAYPDACGCSELVGRGRGDGEGEVLGIMVGEGSADNVCL